MPMVRPNHIWYHYRLPVIVVIIVTNDDRLVAVIIFHRKLLSLDLCQQFHERCGHSQFNISHKIHRFE